MVFQFYGKVGTEKTKSPGGIFMHMAAYSIRKVRLENDPKKIPLMGVMGAFVFATQMINFTIPGTGSSGHLCGGMLLSALLDPSDPLFLP